MFICWVNFFFLDFFGLIKDIFFVMIEKRCNMWVVSLWLSLVFFSGVLGNFGLCCFLLFLFGGYDCIYIMVVSGFICKCLWCLWVSKLLKRLKCLFVFLLFGFCSNMMCLGSLLIGKNVSLKVCDE